MFRQSLLPILVLCMPLANLLQAIPHQQLVVARREDGRGHVHQDADPRIHGEGVAAEKDGRYDARAKVTSEISGDGIGREAPHHNGVGDADGEGDRDGRYERVGGVEASPDDDADEAVDEEFLEEEVALVRLICIGECAEDARHAAVKGGSAVRFQVNGLGSLDLGPVAPHQQQGRDEGAEDLGEDVVGHFAPGEALPDGEADGDGGVEMAAGDRGAGDDGESNADGEGPANLEDGAEHGDAELLSSSGSCREGEGCDGRDTGEAKDGCQSLYPEAAVSNGNGMLRLALCVL
jgi:hypothetical protein